MYLVHFLYKHVHYTISYMENYTKGNNSFILIYLFRDTEYKRRGNMCRCFILSDSCCSVNMVVLVWSHVSQCGI